MTTSTRTDRHRGLPGLVVLLASVALVGCSTSGGGGAAGSQDYSSYAWPEENPRVRLETIVSTDLDIGRRRNFGWLSGDKRSPLFTRPYDVEWLGDSLIVTDPEAGEIIALTFDGRVSRTRESAVTGPLFVAHCDEELVVSSPRSGTVTRFAADLGVIEVVADDLDHPTGIDCREGLIVVTETGRHRLVLLDDKGDRRYIGSRGSEQGRFNFPTAVTLRDHTIWVGDTLNFRIQRIDDRDPEATEVFGHLGDAPGEMPRIKDVELDAHDQVWVSDAHLDVVSLYSRDGRYLMSIGGRGDGPGEFSFPAGIAAHPDGRVAVVDSFNRRIQIFRLDPDQIGNGE